MAVEFIPTPQQMKDLTETNIDFRFVRSNSHPFYYVYADSKVSEFTAEMMGIHKVGVSVNNQVTQLAEVLIEWADDSEYMKFKIWLADYNKHASKDNRIVIPTKY